MKLPSSHEFVASVGNTLVPFAEAVALINSGASLALAGTDAALAKLPAGNWIGGTTPYFMTEDGGITVTDDRVFISDLGALGTVRLTVYAADELARLSGDAPEHGFGLAIIPAGSEAHARFALEAPLYPSTFLKPVVGWIAGYNVATGGVARVYLGGTAYDDSAVVAHVAWEDGALPVVDIINPFTAEAGDVITFAAPGFVHRSALVNGTETALADYLGTRGLSDGQRPLVGDYGGARINVSVKAVDPVSGVVTLYAPVFPGVEYRFAAPLDDYAAALAQGLATRDAEHTFWSCNCVLNYLFGALEGRAIGGVAGPVTFGEIAYQLLNQTLVSIRKI